MTKTWIKTNYVPEGCDYITKGKWYEFEEDVSDDNDAQGGTIYTEVGKLYVRLSGCAHLKRHPWTVYMGDTPPCEPQPNKTIKTEEKKDMSDDSGINWSEAPEGTTHYNKGNCLWYKDGAFGVERFISGRWKGGLFCTSELKEKNFIPRPTEQIKQPSVKEVPSQKIKVGSRVKLKPTSRWNDGCHRNPLGVIGKIIHVGEEWIDVDWSVGVSNNYRLEDLELVSFEEPIINEWKIRHIKSDDYKPKRDVAITILYKEIENGYYEYKFAICSPKDNFSRKVGVTEALKKESDKVYYDKEESSPINSILWHIAFTHKLSKEFDNFLKQYFRSL